jgi:hypothetical protein
MLLILRWDLFICSRSWYSAVVLSSSPAGVWGEMERRGGGKEEGQMILTDPVGSFREHGGRQVVELRG